jgi:hypothetical protein
MCREEKPGQVGLKPGNANLLIGVAKTANREIGVPRGVNI